MNYDIAQALPEGFVPYQPSTEEYTPAPKTIQYTAEQLPEGFVPYQPASAQELPEGFVPYEPKGISQATPADSWEVFKSKLPRPEIEDLNQAPEAETPFWTGARKFVHTIPAALGGIAGGAAAGAAAGAALGSGVPGFGTLAGALAGGIAGGFLGETVKDQALKAIGIDQSEAAQLAVNAKANPLSSFAGELATIPLGGGLGRVPAATRAGAALIGGGFELGSQLYQGEGVDPLRVAGMAAGGGAFAKPYAWQTALEQRLGRTIGRGEQPPPPPPAGVEPPRPSEQGQFPWGAERQPQLPIEEPPPLRGPYEPGPGLPGRHEQLPLGPEPGVTPEGQYTIPYQMPGERGVYPSPHGTPGAVAAAGTAEAKAAPVEVTGTEPRSNRMYGKQAPPVEEGGGVNSGEGDPTVAHALEAATSTRLAPLTAEPPIESPATATAPTYDMLRARVHDAYLDATGGKLNQRVLLNDLRERLPDVDRAALDDTLRKMHLEQGTTLSGMDNPREITPAVREAGLDFKGLPQYGLWITKSERVPATRASVISRRRQERAAAPAKSRWSEEFDPSMVEAIRQAREVPSPRHMQHMLRAQGFTPEQINSLTPEHAWNILRPREANEPPMTMKVYRGSTKGHEQNFIDPNKYGGVFFTPDRIYAERMAQRAARTQGGEPVVTEHEISFRNPYRGGVLTPINARQAGFDAQLAGNEAIIFDPKQIKTSKPSGKLSIVQDTETGKHVLMRGDEQLGEYNTRGQALIARNKAEKATGEQLLRRDIVRGRTGRPLETAPLAIGAEPAILEAGYAKATGPRPPPSEQPPLMQAARRKGPPAAPPAEAMPEWMQRAAAARAAAGAPKPAGPPPGGIPPVPPGRPSPVPPRALLPPAAAPRRFEGLRAAGEKILRRWQETFQPETISPGALRAEPLFRGMKSARSGERDRIFHATQEGEQRWNNKPEEERHGFLSDVENGRTIKPEQQKDAKDLRRMLDEANELEKQVGLKADYRENYFPHEWERPQAGQIPIVEHFRQTLGPNWFQKGRTIDLIEQGLAAGYRLKNSNPYAAVRSRLMAGADLRAQKGLLDELRKVSMAGEHDPVTADRLSRMGWQTINAGGKQWMIAPDVVPLWKNAIAGKSLWSNPNLAGDAFRGWMQFKAFWVPIKLAISGFHALHVGHISFSSNLARAVDQIAVGDINSAAKSLEQSLTTAFRPKATLPGGKSIAAKQVQAEWLLGEHVRTPEGKIAVQYMEEGGFVPHMSEQLRSDARQKLDAAWKEMNPFKLAFHAPRELVRRIQAPMFETWIPRVKTAAFLNDATALLQRKPELNSDPIARKMALSAIGKSIDNRFGEMFYDGLFWNRMTKDLSIGSFLSLGWNLGFAREFGGAAIEAVTRPAGKVIPGMAPSAERQIIRDATNKIKFASIYMGTAMMIGGLMTKMFTGENPQDMSDYIFPRAGGVNPDGSPRRLTTMFYTREAPMLAKHIQEYGGGIGGTLSGAMSMLWNKTLFQPIKELLQNKSYFGSEIWDTNAPGYKQLLQGAQHVFGQQFSPMSMTGAQQAERTMGVEPKWYPTTGQGALAYAGFGPAPKYAEASAMQNRIGHLFREHVAPASRPYQDPDVTQSQMEARTRLMIARQSGTPIEKQTALREAIKAGISRQTLAKIGKISTDQTMFARLPREDQISLLQDATSEEYKRYWPHASAKTKMQWRKEHPKTGESIANAI